MAYSIKSLEEQGKNNLVVIANYFLGLQLGFTKKFKPSAYMLKTVTATVDKIMNAEVGKRFEMDAEEFGVLYAGAHYMMVAMTTPEGPAYVNSIFQDRTEEFKSEMVIYFRDTCMYFVNECNDRYAEVPEFAMLRRMVEKQMTERR